MYCMLEKMKERAMGQGMWYYVGGGKEKGLIPLQSLKKEVWYFHYLNLA